MDNPTYHPEDGTTTQQSFAISRYIVNNGLSSDSNDQLVTVKTRGARLNGPFITKKLFIILVVIIILLLIGLITIGILYAKTVGAQICTSDECLRTAANLRYSMDFDINPCDNFYQYTCGHWSIEHPNHGWYPSFSTFGTINERVTLATLNFLTSKPEINETEPNAIQQSKDLFQSCLDTDAANALGYSVIFKYLKEVGLPEVPSLFTLSEREKLKFKINWTNVEGDIKKIFKMDVFIGMGVTQNQYNRSENVIVMGTPGNSCPLPSPLQKSDKRKKVATNQRTKLFEDTDDARTDITKKIIKHAIIELSQNSSGKTPDPKLLELAATVLVNMSRTLEELGKNSTSALEPEATPMLVEDLQTLIDNYTTTTMKKNDSTLFERYILNVFENTNVTIDFTKDYVHIPETEMTYLLEIVAYLLDTSDLYIELYLWWSTVYVMIINTTSEMMEFVYKSVVPFYGHSSLLAKPEAVECADIVSAFMGMAVSYGIIDRTFSSDTEPKVFHMLQDIKNAFVERVSELHWMDGETKKATLEKSRNMISFIGYPSTLFEEGLLDKWYANVEIHSDTFLENMISLTKRAFPQTLETLRVPNPRSFIGDPLEPNAYHAFQDNTISILCCSNKKLL